jgi:hypothetical protein
VIFWKLDSFDCKADSIFSERIKPVIQKLPVGIQNKWRDRAILYKKQSNTVFPAFSFFCTFIQEMASTFNDPGFDFGTGYVADATMVHRRGAKSQVFSHETSITSDFWMLYLSICSGYLQEVFVSLA